MIIQKKKKTVSSFKNSIIFFTDTLFAVMRTNLW